MITMTSQWARLRLKSPASPLFTQPFIRAQIKENIKAPRHWPLCGEFTGTGEFPAQMASNAENVSIWWRHHVLGYKLNISTGVIFPTKQFSIKLRMTNLSKSHECYDRVHVLAPNMVSKQSVDLVPPKKNTAPLQWRHNGCDGISNHQHHECLLSRLFRRR